LCVPVRAHTRPASQAHTRTTTLQDQLAVTQQHLREAESRIGQLERTLAETAAQLRTARTEAQAAAGEAAELADGLREVEMELQAERSAHSLARNSLATARDQLEVADGATRAPRSDDAC
jgi:chromosome segregation ATPase